MLHAHRPAGVKGMDMRAVIDRPGVLGQSGARGEARDSASNGSPRRPSRASEAGSPRSTNRSEAPVGARGRPASERRLTRQTTSWPRETSSRTVARPIVRSPPEPERARGVMPGAGAGLGASSRSARERSSSAGSEGPPTTSPDHARQPAAVTSHSTKPLAKGTDEDARDGRLVGAWAGCGKP